jgi:tetratricopeptide (TPR) repeat protein
MAVMKQKEKTFFELTVEFLLKYRVPLSVLLIAIILLITIAIVLNYVETTAGEKAERQYDAAQFNLDSISYITNVSERDALYQQQMQSLVNLARSYPRTLAAERARLLLGRFYLQAFFNAGNTQLLEQAYTNYNFAYLSARTDFYKALSLIGRAQSLEQENKYDEAFSDYSMVANRYSNQGFTPLVLIGMARCREQMSDIPKAIEFYKRLVKEYPESEWAYFAKGKIYYYTENALKTAVTNTNVQLILPQ